jgi:hypothetical protein
VDRFVKRNARLVGAQLVVLFLTGTLHAVAQVQHPPPSSQVPTPAPARTPSSGWQLTADGSLTFISQSTNGPGTLPPEGPGFAKGSPLSPLTPYDAFSSAPLTPGNAGITQFETTGTYTRDRFRASASVGFGYVDGSATNAAYWGEDLFPSLNPHLGKTALPFQILFPTNNHSDDASVARVSLLGASAGAADGSWTLRGGYFDLAQTNRFLFIQPTLTSVTPGFSLVPAESLGDGGPSQQWWPASEPGLPMYGADAMAHHGLATLELSDAQVPALPRTSARLTMGSLFIDHGNGIAYSLQALHVTTGGDLISTTTVFGADAHTVLGPQGELPISTLGGQRETMVGGSASFPIGPSTNVLAQIGEAWYDADNVIEPGTQKPGSYDHLAFTQRIRRGNLTVEGFYFSPRYATAILPYGTPENVWSAAWSWPGQWLKSNFQLVDNTAIGANREGVRVKYASGPGALQWRVEYENYRQILPSIFDNVNQTGFVDGFFLPQVDDFGTIGNQHQYAAWVSWTQRFGTLSVDYVNDQQFRPYIRPYALDYVNTVAPQIVITYSRPLSPRLLAAIGGGQYAMHGTWAQTPVDFRQNIGFIGGEWQQSSMLGLFAEVRSSGFTGLPSMINGPSPDFHGAIGILEERLHF